jgi:hypothetical protein
MSAIALGGRLAAGIFGAGVPAMAGGGLPAMAGTAMAGAIGGGLATAAGPSSAAGRVLDFRRRGAPPRRRRRSPLLALGKPLGIAAMTVALPLALGAWLLSSRQFQLHGIAVVRPAAALAGSAPAAALAGFAPRVPAAWVRQALAPLLGRNLLRLPLAEVRLRLAANPWVAAVEVAKELPDRLRVSVAERRPALLLRLGEELLYADAAGRPIAPVDSPAAAAALRRQGLLVVSLPPLLARPQPPGAALAGAGSGATIAGVVGGALIAGVAGGAPGMDSAAGAGVAGALRLAAQLRLLRPEWTQSLSQIDVVDEDDFRLRVDGLPCPLLVRGSRLADNLVRFEQLLPELRRRYPALAAVDLRYSRRIVVQPAAAATAAAKAAAAAAAAPAATASVTGAAVKPAPPAAAVKPAPAAAAAPGRGSETI